MEWKKKNRFFGVGILGSFLGMSLLACGGTDTGSGGGNKCSGLNEGDLIITEFMANPKGTDDWQEYIEIYNPTSNPIELKGVKLFRSKNDGSSETSKWTFGEATIQPGQYFTVGDFNTEPDETTGIAAEPYAHLDYIFDTKFALRGDNGLIGFRCGSTIIDQVTYTSTKEAQAQILSGDKLSSIDNDDEANWCAIPKEEQYIIASLPYVSNSGSTSSNYGTPKQANPKCEAGDVPITVPDGQCMDNGVARAIASPEAGELLITEVMVKPNGEGAAQWFEIYARSEFDLNDLVIKKGETATKYTIKANDCISLSEGMFAVVATAEDESIGADIVVVPTGKLSLNTSSNRNVSLYTADDVLLDSYNYGTPAEGASLQLTSEKFGTERAGIDDGADYCASTGNAYDSNGNLGTPGGTNALCAGQAVEGQCMDNGVARDITSPEAGDLLITEVMSVVKLEGATSNDRDKNYIEIYAKKTVDLNGVALRKYTSNGESYNDWKISDSACIRLAAGEYILIAKTGDTLLNGGLSQDAVVVLSNMSLNQTGKIELVIPETETTGAVIIDSIHYEKPESNYSWQRSSDFSDVFCPSTQSYATGLYGTPGTANGECTDAPGPTACSGISAGAIIITEIMANPVGNDDWQEYVEIYNATSSSISLSGVKFAWENPSGTSTKSWDFGDTSIPAHAYFVFGDTQASPLPAHLNYGFTSKFSLPNGGGKLTLTCGETMIDIANYPQPADGRALILTTESAAANDDTANWCSIVRDAQFLIETLGESNYGTPGKSGGTCG